MYRTFKRKKKEKRNKGILEGQRKRIFTNCKRNFNGNYPDRKKSKAGLKTFLFENGQERDFFVVLYKERE